MHFPHSLRYKLLISWLGSILIILTMVGGLFYYLHESKLTDATLQNIKTSFQSLNAELQARRDELIKNANIIANRDDIVSSISMIDTYQDIENYQAKVFDVEKQRLMRKLSRQARAAGLDLLLVHSANDTLAGYYNGKDKDGELVGYQSFDDGKPSYHVAQNLENIFREQKAPPPFYKRLLSTHNNEGLQVFLIGDQQGVIMETHANLMRQHVDGPEQKVGLVHAAYLLDDIFIKDLEKLTGLELAMFQSDGSHFGRLENIDIGGNRNEIPYLDQGGATAETFRQISNDDYVLGVAQLSMTEGQQLFFVFGKTRNDLALDFSSFEQAIFAVLFVAVIIVVPAAGYYLNNTFSQPIENLLSGVESLRKGNFSELQGFTGKDELSALAQSFNSMANEINIRETRLRNSEERFALAMRGANDGLWDWNLKTDAVYYSPRWASMLGYEQEELEPVLDNALVRMHPSDKDRVLKEAQAYISGITDSFETEFRMRHKDGSWIWVISRGFLVLENEEPVRLVGTHVDITSRKQDQAQLIQTAKLATLGEMAAGIAHELSQPLNIISMQAEILLDPLSGRTIPTQELAPKLEKIREQTERAATIINHMRIFGRTESDELKSVDLKEAVKGATDLVKEQMRLSGIEVSLNLPETCRQVMGQQIQLEQVVLNLLTNARDAIRGIAENGSLPRIEIQITDEPLSDKVELSVQDSGGGIPQEVLEYIFDPFFTTKDVGKGTGLGLSISYGIITGMKGEIVADNVDNGAKFTIALQAWNGNTTIDKL